MAPGFPEELFNAFGDAIGASVSFDHHNSGPVPPDDPFASGECDLGWVCSTSFVGLHHLRSLPSVRLAGVAWVPDDPEVNGRPVYFGDVVVRPDDPARSVSDLAGRSVGLNDPISLSGSFSFRHRILADGLRPDDFASLQYTGGHNRSLDALVAGEIDSACVDSVVRLQRALTDDGVASLRVLERLGPWPTQPLVMRVDLDPEVGAEVQRALLAAQEQPRIRALMAQAGLAKLVAVDETHYEPVRAAMVADAGSGLDGAAAISF